MCQVSNLAIKNEHPLANIVVGLRRSCLIAANRQISFNFIVFLWVVYLIRREWTWDLLISCDIVSCIEKRKRYFLSWSKKPSSSLAQNKANLPLWPENWISFLSWPFRQFHLLTVLSYGWNDVYTPDANQYSFLFHF